MSIFRNPLPTPPGPREKFDPNREADSIIATSETQSVVQGLSEYLDEYPPTEIISKDGTRYIVLARESGSEESSNDYHPLECVDASDSEGSKVRVVFGTIGPAEPTEMSPGDNPQCIIPVSGSGYIVGFVEVSGSNDVTVSHVVALGSVPPNTTTRAYRMIGSFSHPGGTLSVASAVTGSLGYNVCRDADSVLLDDWVPL